MATLSIQVLAPSWMGIDEIRVYTSGCQLLQSYAVDAGQVTPPNENKGEFFFLQASEFIFVCKTEE